MNAKFHIQWPDFYPSNCPPEDAVDTNHTVFRFISGFPPSMNDFRSYKEVNLNRHFGEMECQACGLSVCMISEDIIDKRRDIPGFSKKQIAVGKLLPGDGVIKATPSLQNKFHHTWWNNLTIQILG